MMNAFTLTSYEPLPAYEICPSCGNDDLSFYGFTANRTDANITDTVSCDRCRWSESVRLVCPFCGEDDDIAADADLETFLCGGCGERYPTT